MRYHRLLLVLFLILATSCDEAYRKWEKDAFGNMTWRKGQALIFSPKIRDITTTYDLILGIRHVYGAKIPSVPIVLRMIAPSGKETIHRFTLPVTSAEGRVMATCAGDICDLEARVGELVFTEPGEYKFIVTHEAARETIRGIMEFGLVLKTGT